MNDLRQETINTYNKSAKQLAEYFRGIGSRTQDIDLAFRLAGNPEDARVVEIGCGDGRDAKEIVKRAGWYVGFDISEELIKLAHRHVPTATFEVADATSFAFPKNLDIVFAFASLLHTDKEETREILVKAYKALKPGSICYLSLKYSEHYEEKIKADEYGRRLFYFYNPALITELAGEKYKVVYEQSQTIGKTDWFTIALKKR